MTVRMELVLLETSSLSIINKEPADHRPNAFGSCTHRGVAALASLRADQKRSADPREQVGGLSCCVSARCSAEQLPESLLR